MKVKLLIAFSLFTSQFTFSQNEELLQGKVVNQNRPIKDVDIINFNTKARTISDESGNFSIAAKKDDLLVFISKNYEIKKLVINPNLFDQNSFVVVLNLKPEELEEVVITKMKSIELSKDKKYELEKLNDIIIDNAMKKAKVIGVYDGTILYGTNLLPLVSMIVGLFIKEKEPVKVPAPKIEFIALAKNTCDQIFFTERLKLKPDQIDLFLQFCDADPKSKTLIENHNILSMMDFLSTKNIEFQKLKN